MVKVTVSVLFTAIEECIEILEFDLVSLMSELTIMIRTLGICGRLSVLNLESFYLVLWCLNAFDLCSTTATSSPPAAASPPIAASTLLLFLLFIFIFSIVSIVSIVSVSWWCIVIGWLI